MHFIFPSIKLGINAKLKLFFCFRARRKCQGRHICCLHYSSATNPPCCEPSSWCQSDGRRFRVKWPLLEFERIFVKGRGGWEVELAFRSNERNVITFRLEYEDDVSSVSPSSELRSVVIWPFRLIPNFRDLPVRPCLCACSLALSFVKSFARSFTRSFVGSFVLNHPIVHSSLGFKPINERTTVVA